jgi:hypothetical protein
MQARTEADAETRPYVIAVVAEGYSASDVADEQGIFAKDVKRIVNRGAMAYEPFASNKAQFVVRPVPVVSNEAEVAGEQQTRDTAFGVKFHGRQSDCYFTVSEAAVGKISAKAREDGDADYIVVLVNAGASKGVGCAIKDKIALVTRKASGAGLAHELGHTIADLYDEYTAAKAGVTQISSGNCTTADVQTAAPWRDLITQTINVPTARNANIPVAMYEGCAHYDTKVYRPTMSCMMANPPEYFCVVCQGLLMDVINTLPKAGLNLYERFRVLVPTASQTAAIGQTGAIVLDHWVSATPPPPGKQPLHNVWALTLGDRVLGAAGTNGEASLWRAHEDGAPVAETFVPAPFEVVEIAIPRSRLTPPSFVPCATPELRLFSFPERKEEIAPAELTTVAGFPVPKTVAQSPQLTSAVLNLFQ